jgi:hypothetical protein
MVVTVQSTPQARGNIPAVNHADGTGRIQIVRAGDASLLRLPEGARPPHRRGIVGQHFPQCRRPDRADATTGD